MAGSRTERQKPFAGAAQVSRGRDETWHAGGLWRRKKGQEREGRIQGCRSRLLRKGRGREERSGKVGRERSYTKYFIKRAASDGRLTMCSRTSRKQFKERGGNKGEMEESMQLEKENETLRDLRSTQEGWDSRRHMGLKKSELLESQGYMKGDATRG